MEQTKQKKVQTVFRGPSVITEGYLMFAHYKLDKLTDPTECVCCITKKHTVEEHNKIIKRENARIYQYFQRNNTCIYRRKEFRPKTPFELFGPAPTKEDFTPEIIAELTGPEPTEEDLKRALNVLAIMGADV